MASFLAPLTADPTAPLSLRNVRTGATLATRLEPAFDSKTRNRGLLGRTDLPRGTALVIAPCNGVHTFFMKFAIDALFVDKDGTVRRIAAGLQPWRIALSPRSFAVIEMKAGTISGAEVRPGDRLSIAGS